jgi:hypothetical protein
MRSRCPPGPCRPSASVKLSARPPTDRFASAKGLCVCGRSTKAMLGEVTSSRPSEVSSSGFLPQKPGAEGATLGGWRGKYSHLPSRAAEKLPESPESPVLKRCVPGNSGNSGNFLVGSAPKKRNFLETAGDRALESRRVCLERHAACVALFPRMVFGSEFGPIMRTCWTRFSALPVEDIVRELLVAHARPGLHKVYDLHAYEKEKAHALKLWHEKLKQIVGGKLVLQ